MTASTSKLIAIFTCSAIVALASAANAQQYQTRVQQQGNTQPAVQVAPHYTSLGVMSRFISLRAPVQIGGGYGGGEIRPSVAPGYGTGASWAYNGYQIHSVTHGGVACRAGLETGDIIVMLNGRLMTCRNALDAAVASSQNQRVSCIVINVRSGHLTTVWCDFTGGGYTQPGFGGGEIRPSYQSNPATNNQ